MQNALLDESSGKAFDNSNITLFLKKALLLLSKKKHAAILIGNKGIETGLALRLLESETKNKVLNGIYFDAFTGKRLSTKETTVGLGIGKAFETGKVKLGLGSYVTKPVISFFNTAKLKSVKDLNFTIGITSKWKF